jgi:hypothetical protein
MAKEAAPTARVGPPVDRRRATAAIALDVAPRGSGSTELIMVAIR